MATFRQKSPSAPSYFCGMNDHLSLLRQLLSEHANPQRALEMSAYMKNRFAYFGLSKPHRAALTKSIMKDFAADASLDTEEFVKCLWMEPERELLYFAMEFVEKRKFWKKEESIELFEWMITHQSWWDSVDHIAAHFVGDYFIAFPKKKKEITARWASSDHLWLNRTAIIFQLFYKEDTDFELMKKYIAMHSTSKEFFHQKAIGWALRQYGKTNPDAVIEFVENAPMANLSKREAMKHLGNR